MALLFNQKIMGTERKTFHLEPNQCKEIEKRAKKLKVTESFLMRTHFNKVIEAIDAKEDVA